MISRPLGKTGIQVSEIAFGGVEIGIPYGIGVNSAKDMISGRNSIKLLHAALDAGINFFDTARMYGKSESIIGKAFKNKRKEVILSTKCKHFLDEKGNLPAKDDLKSIIEASFKESLEALQTDFIDVFMLHQCNYKILENEVIKDIFLDLKRTGKIRATGISTYSSEETAVAIKMGGWDVIQLPFNLMDQRQSVNFSKAFEKGTAIIIRSVLMKGLLSDRGKNLHPALKSVESHISNYDELKHLTSYSLPELAIKFALSFPEVSSTLVGIDRIEYLQSCLKSADGIYLDNNVLQKAKKLSYPEPRLPGSAILG